MSANRKIRIAVVGLGFGRQWARAYKGLPDVDSVGICDSDVALLKSVGEELGIERRHADLDSVLRSGAYDAVHLVTPIPLHVEQAVEVLRAGLHCACAIPMALRLEGIEAILEAQSASGKIYMLMETEVFSPFFLYAMQLHRQGAFGEIQLLRGYHYQNMEGWPKYWMGLPPMYYSYHGLGPALFLAGARPRRVRCLGSGRLSEELRLEYGNPFPIESALLELEGMDAICEITCALFKMARGFLVDRFSVYGERLGLEAAQLSGEGIVLFESAQGSLEPGRRGREVKGRRMELPALAELVPEAIADYVRASKSPRCIPAAHEFVRSIVEGRPASVDQRVAADWTAAALCAHESAMHRGEGVDIPRFS